MIGRKRIRAALLALALLLALAAPALADGDPTIRVTGGEAAPGETVTVSVTLENNPGIASMRLELAYDSSRLTLTDGEIAPAFANASMANVIVNTETNPAVANWFVFSGKVSADGVFCTLTFRVRDDAPGGEAPVTVSFDPDDVFDGSMVNVDFSVINGSVTVTGGAGEAEGPSGETEEPSETEQSGETEQPAETEKPTESEQPAATEKPGEAEQSGETAEPVLTTGEQPGGETAESEDLTPQIGVREETLRREETEKKSFPVWLLPIAVAVIAAGILLALRLSKKGKKLIASDDTPDENEDDEE